MAKAEDPTPSVEAYISSHPISFFSTDGTLFNSSGHRFPQVCSSHLESDTDYTSPRPESSIIFAASPPEIPQQTGQSSASVKFSQ